MLSLSENQKVDLTKQRLKLIDDAKKLGGMALQIEKTLEQMHGKIQLIDEMLKKKPIPSNNKNKNKKKNKK